MKYIKRMRAANKERERVTKLTTMRRVSQKRYSKAITAVKQVKPGKRLKKGFFFGMSQTKQEW